ncbi:hypothetical protein LXL04_021647 [Taraxacum kok-saghyz]
MRNCTKLVIRIGVINCEIINFYDPGHVIDAMPSMQLFRIDDFIIYVLVEFGVRYYWRFDFSFIYACFKFGCCYYIRLGFFNGLGHAFFIRSYKVWHDFDTFFPNHRHDIVITTYELSSDHTRNFGHNNNVLDSEVGGKRTWVQEDIENLGCTLVGLDSVLRTEPKPLDFEQQNFNAKTSKELEKSTNSYT